MEQYALYLALKQIASELGDEFKISFNDADLNNPNVLAIYVKGGEAPPLREISDGEYFNLQARVQFFMQCGYEESIYFKMLSRINQIKYAVLKAYNKRYNVSNQLMFVGENLELRQGEVLEGTEVYLTILSAALLGEVDFKGKTGQGFPRYSLNIKIEYTLKGGK